MYKIVLEKDRKAMSMDEIKKAYSGKWIFSIHTEDNPFSRLFLLTNHMKVRKKEFISSLVKIQKMVLLQSNTRTRCSRCNCFFAAI